MLTFMYPWVIYAGAGAVAVYALAHVLLRRYVVYVVPTTSLFMQYLHRHNLVYSQWQRYVRYVLRILAFLALLCALARPREPDEQTAITIEGRDIVLALDVSGSMQLFDDPQDPRNRWEVAKEEARRFIAQRTYDPIGLVYFASFAVSRCPITMDRSLLDSIVKDTHLGDINPNGTMLAQAVALGVQRMRHAVGTSKVIILLTDGSPSEEDMSINTALSLAQKAGVKVYTIGVGSDEGGYYVHPLAGVHRVPHAVNFSLLKHIAQETGGVCFQARNPRELQAVYQEIDALEASEHDAPEYTRYYEYFMPCLWAALGLLMGELILTTWIWVAI